MIRNTRGYNSIDGNIPLVKTGNNHTSKPFENGSISQELIESRKPNH